MGSVLFIILTIVVLNAIKLPPSKASTSGEFTVERRRQLRKAARRSRQKNSGGGLPWFGKRKRTRKEYYWDF
ncbi:MAG: hypothetical protein K2L28_05185 [Muribaculaceae bacterium]|nr:hypothetical protein [Muribaculaceae bacterium]